MEALVLDVPTVGGTAVQPLSASNIHPVVLFSILDHYARRDATQTRVIGGFALEIAVTVTQRSRVFVCCVVCRCASRHCKRRDC
jgi:hypothetical protein